MATNIEIKELKKDQVIKSVCNFEINISFYQTNQSDIAIKSTFIHSVHPIHTHSHY